MDQPESLGSPVFHPIVYWAPSQLLAKKLTEAAFVLSFLLLFGLVQLNGALFVISRFLRRQQIALNDMIRISSVHPLRFVLEWSSSGAIKRARRRKSSSFRKNELKSESS